MTSRLLDELQHTYKNNLKLIDVFFTVTRKILQLKGLSYKLKASLNQGRRSRGGWGGFSPPPPPPHFLRGRHLD